MRRETGVRRFPLPAFRGSYAQPQGDVQNGPAESHVYRKPAGLSDRNLVHGQSAGYRAALSRLLSTTGGHRWRTSWISMAFSASPKTRTRRPSAMHTGSWPAATILTGAPV